MCKKTYLVTFTPSGPYFFGNEKTFSFTKSEESLYFIRGEKLPSQSTILGALRYLALPKKTYKDADDAGDLIGKESFDMDYAGETPQTFGAIRSISPLFLCGPEEKKEPEEEKTEPEKKEEVKYRMLIPTPFDHNCGAEKKALEEHREKEADLPKKRKTKFRYSYTPFKNYCKDAAESRLYTPDYDSKAGIADSFVSLTKDKVLGGYEIVDTVDADGDVPLFGSDIRVGVNLNAQNDGFFKKEYRTLAKGYSFAVYAELDDEVFGSMKTKPQTVMLGQGKVPFSVKFEEHENNLEEQTEEMLQDTHSFLPVGQTIVYCMGDMLAGEERKDSLFSVVQTKDYRAYLTGIKGKPANHIAKGTSLHKLIRAGSVFLLESEKAAEDWGKSAPKQQNEETINITRRKQQNAKTIGFNQTAQYTQK